MNRIAIVVYSQTGHTQRIGMALAEKFGEAKARVSLFNLADGPGPTSDDLKHVDAVVIGCPVYLGDFPQQLLDWTWEHHDELNAMSVGIYTVSLSAADPRPKARAGDDKVLRNLLGQTDLAPWFVASFGGALQYTRYGVLKRVVMQSMSAAAGGPTDASRDFDLTNWDDVADFARDFLEGDFRSRFATVNRLSISGEPNWIRARARVA